MKFFKMTFLALSMLLLMAAATLTTATKNVTTAGTRVALSSTHIYPTSVLVQAKPGNTGYIYIGDSSVSSSNGVRLSAGDKLGLGADAPPSSSQGTVDLSTIYIDSSVNGEGILIYYVK